MWWAIETLTTVGYGDLVPVTVFGKLVGGFVTIIGVVAVALFTSLITVSFIDQLHLRREALRKAVEASLADGVITIDERAAIEKFSDRLGLPPEAAAAAVEEALAVCPHCGAPLVGTPASSPLGLPPGLAASQPASE
jgi:voltage-gated potassium channel